MPCKIFPHIKKKTNFWQTLRKICIELWIIYFFTFLLMRKISFSKPYKKYIDFNHLRDIFMFKILREIVWAIEYTKSEKIVSNDLHTIVHPKNHHHHYHRLLSHTSRQSESFLVEAVHLVKQYTAAWLRQRPNFKHANFTNYISFYESQCRVSSHWAVDERMRAVTRDNSA